MRISVTFLQTWEAVLPYVAIAAASVVLVIACFMTLSIFNRIRQGIKPVNQLLWSLMGGYVFTAGILAFYYTLWLNRYLPEVGFFYLEEHLLSFFIMLLLNTAIVRFSLNIQYPAWRLMYAAMMILGLIAGSLLISHSVANMLVGINNMPLWVVAACIGTGGITFCLNRAGVSLQAKRLWNGWALATLFAASWLVTTVLLQNGLEYFPVSTVQQATGAGGYLLSRTVILLVVTAASGLVLMLFVLMAIMDKRLTTMKRNLQQSDAFGSQLLDSLSEGVYGLDNSGSVTFINKVAQELLGYRAADVIGKKFDHIFHDGHTDIIASDHPHGTHSSPASGYQLINNETVLYRSDGKELLVVEERIPLIREGSTVGTVVSFRDVSAMIKLREQLKTRAEEDRSLGKLMRIALQNDGMEAFLQEALESLLDSISWLSLMPKGGVFITTQKGSGHILQLKASVGLGEEIKNMCSSVRFGQCLCGRAAEQAIIQFADCVDERHENRFDGMAPHGHYNVPIKDENTVVGVIVLYLPHGHKASGVELAFLMRVSDIFSLGIKQRYVEQSLLEMQVSTQHMVKLNNELIEAIASAVIAVGNDDRVTHWNSAAEALLDVTAADAVGKPILNLGVALDWSVISPVILQLKTGQIDQYKEDCETELHGHYKILSIAITPFNLSAQESGYLLLIADVTEEREMEQQLRQAEKMQSIGQLAAGIAHEINTPIQYVGDNVRFLREAYEDISVLIQTAMNLYEESMSADFDKQRLVQLKEKADEIDLEFLQEEIPGAVGQSQEGIHRVAQIVRAMKDFSHPGSDDKEYSDINRAIESTIMVTRNVWKYIAEVETHLEPDLPMVPVFLGPFNEVILNMIVNAAHAIGDVVDTSTGSKGMITIETKSFHNDWVSISISDTGCGMTKEVMHRIFDPFFTTKEVGKGTGQGLSLSHKIIHDQHGGKIQVESEPGKGTTFRIMLPVEASAREGRAY